MRVVVSVLITEDLRGLERLLAALAVQGSREGAVVECLVVDNAEREMGEWKGRERALVSLFEGSEIITRYVREPRMGIPFARNAAVCYALDQDVDALIFIDDDEWPGEGWLDALIGTWRGSGADVVVGPAKGVLPKDAPRWARKSGIFDKDRYLSDGAHIRTAYSYNTLLSRKTLQTLGPSFDRLFRYGGGSDHDYFKRAALCGLRSVWSPEAQVYERVKAERLEVKWVFKRGYRIGVAVRMSALRRFGKARAIAKVGLLVVTNLAYGGANVAGTMLPGLSWVVGVRRFGMAMGLVVGNLFRYEEYRRKESKPDSPVL